jgi:hypothetical protein
MVEYTAVSAKAEGFRHFVRRKQDRQCTYIITFMRICETSIAVEKR